jgi:hypothetical protein
VIGKMCIANECSTVASIWSDLGGSSSFSNGACCGVNGVTCDATSTFVVEINWPGTQLTGTLPFSIGSLTQLVSLNLTQHVDLQKWAYGDNGSVSCQTYCQVNWNNELPNEWNGARCLQSVYAKGKLAGQPIDCCAVAGMEYGVQCLCQKTGLGWTGAWVTQQKCPRGIIGAIPSSIGNLTKLKTLDLSGNSFTTLPSMELSSVKVM